MAIVSIVQDMITNVRGYVLPVVATGFVLMTAAGYSYYAECVPVGGSSFEVQDDHPSGIRWLVATISICCFITLVFTCTCVSRSKYESKENECDVLRGMCNTKDKEIADLKSKLQVLLKEKETATRQVNDLHVAKQVLASELQRKSEKEKQLGTEKKTLQAEIENLTKQVNDFHVEKEGLVSELKSKSDKEMRLEYKKKKLEGNVAMLTKQVDDLHVEKGKVESELQSKSKKEMQLEHEKKALEGNIRLLTKQVDDFSVEKRKLESELQSKSEKVQELECNSQLLTSEIKKKSIEVIELSRNDTCTILVHPKWEKKHQDVMEALMKKLDDYLKTEKSFTSFKWSIERKYGDTPADMRIIPCKFSTRMESDIEEMMDEIEGLKGGLPASLVGVHHMTEQGDLTVKSSSQIDSTYEKKFELITDTRYWEYNEPMLYKHNDNDKAIVQLGEFVLRNAKPMTDNAD